MGHGFVFVKSNLVHLVLILDVGYSGKAESPFVPGLFSNGYHAITCYYGEKTSVESIWVNGVFTLLWAIGSRFYLII